VDWQRLLLEAGGRDEIEHAAAHVHSHYLALSRFCAARGCWLITLPGFEPDGPGLQRLQGLVHSVMRDAPKRGKPNSPKEDEFSYRTVSATKFPCSCAYEYAGYKQSSHRLGQYGGGVERKAEHHIAFLDELATHVNSSLLRRLPGARSEINLPGYWVMNRYINEHQCIGPHHDADPIFRTDDWPSAIFGRPMWVFSGVRKAKGVESWEPELSLGALGGWGESRRAGVLGT
jgi:hypothetical protein